MDYPIYIDTLLARICPFCILRGHVHVKISLIKYIFVPEDCFYFSKTVETLMKCCLKQHFIWVSTVCQSRVNIVYALNPNFNGIKRLCFQLLDKGV